MAVGRYSDFFPNFVPVMYPRILHRLLWLVPAIVFCLFRPAECGTPAEGSAARCDGRRGAIVDRAADEFRCERICNSDLDFPHALCRRPAPVRTVARTVRGGYAVKRPAARPETCGSPHVGAVCAVSLYKRFRTVASGVPVVDFYVYRLRPLFVAGGVSSGGGLSIPAPRRRRTERGRARFPTGRRRAGSRIRNV